MSVGGIAPQSTTSKGRRARGEASWSERAASSLPVPDSPVMSTGTDVGAARSSVAYTARIGPPTPRGDRRPGGAQRHLHAPVARHHLQAGAPELHLHLAARRDLTHREGADAGAVAAAEVANLHPVVGGLDLAW
jgi:hypothetical protein